jgi:pimeloyl-ACP methyl ester carboxylesterase
MKRTHVMKRALLVHGLLRGPMSMMPLAGPLRRAGLRPGFFWYASTIESWERIVDRLTRRLNADRPDLVIGHSLGGLLLRTAMAKSTATVGHFVTLGTPHREPRLAKWAATVPGFRIATGDSGRLLLDDEAIRILPVPNVPTTCFAGTMGHRWQFGDRANDGIVAVAEASIDPNQAPKTVHAFHTVLQAHPDVRRTVGEIARSLRV